MKLYLVRHGEAEPKTVHPERPLTPDGRAEVERVAAALKDRVKNCGAIWHSTKTRARETAEILAKHLNPTNGCLEREGLAPNDPVAPVALEIESADADVMIVSHIPFLPKLAGRLLTGNEDAEPIRLGTAGIACLEADDALHWRVVWRITPDVSP